MKLRYFPLPLRFTVPLLLFLFGGLTGAWTFQQQITAANRRAEDRIRWEARSNGIRITGLLEYLFRRTETAGSEIEGADLIVRQLVSDSNLKLVALLDHADRLLLSSDRTLQNQVISQTYLAALQPKLAQARRKLAGKIMIMSDSKEIIAIYPFYLRAQPGELYSARLGVLLLKYDLVQQNQLAYQEAITQFLYTLPMLAGLCFLVWLLFEQVLTRRAAQLMAISRRFAQGELDARIQLSGSDELAQISQAFDRMAAQIQQKTEILCQSELQQRQQTQQLERALLQLQETQAQLVHTEKMSSLGQLVAGVAHEINNPVSFIHGNLSHVSEYATMLLDLVTLYQATYPEPPEKIQSIQDDLDLAFVVQDFPKILRSMQLGTQRISTIVLSLRNFSRLDESAMKPVDIHEGIESTLLILKNRLKGNSDRPEITIDKIYGQLPLVECYAGQLNQVFMNILANAIDALDDKYLKLKQEKQERGREWGKEEKGEAAPATETVFNRFRPLSLLQKENAPRICIHTEAIPPHSATLKQVRITIADNALGIPESVQTQIFNPFFTTKPVGQGTGLGLSISYKIVVNQHKGNLTCETKADEGTKFIIEIPIVQGFLFADGIKTA